MKLFNRKEKSEDQQFREWLVRANRQVRSKHFVVLWADMENQKDLKNIDRMIDLGYELITIYGVFLEGTRVILKRPMKEIID